MRTDLSWSYAAAGWPNTSNAIGYLIGALGAARLIERFGAGPAAISGISLCIQSLILCAVLRDAVLLNLARTLGGIGGGLGYIGAALVATDIATRHPEKESFLLALLYTGPGMGIMLSGATLPFALSALGPGSWPYGWTILVAISLPLWLVLPLGFRGAATGRTSEHTPVASRPMWPMLGGYCLFGAGYIAYMTFMIALVRDGGGSIVQQSLFWIVIGIAAMFSPVVWAGTIRNSKGGRAFATIGLATTIGATLPMLSTSWTMLLLSAAIFGSAFFAVVASTTSFVRHNLPRSHWGGAVGMMTIVFGIGQIAGPVLSGYVTDRMGSLTSGLMLSAILLVAGAALGLMQNPLSERDAIGKVE